MSDEAGVEDEELSFGQIWGHLAELTAELLEHPDPAVVRQTEELLDWVDVFHRDGLGRVVEMMRAWRGELFLNSLAADELTGTMLAAYGLGEGEELAADAAEAVDGALDEVRPLVESHGGALQVESIQDGVVELRMLGTCDGCPSSSATLTYGVEASLRSHWPNFRRLELLDPPSEADPSKADLECFTEEDASSVGVKLQLQDRPG